MRELRELIGLPRYRLCKVLGIGLRTLQRYENEEICPANLDTLIRLSVLSGWTLDEVVRHLGVNIPTREELLQEDSRFLT